jgi:tripartite-type tricarboxylate transporter receptor subunit TctC
MIKKIVTSIIFGVVLTVPTLARETLEVISRFDSHITTSILAREIMSEVQKMQNKYEFRFTTVPGASGENADMRAITLSRTGRKVMVAGSSSTWSRNSFVFKDTFNRREDIIPMIGYGGTPFAIQVSPTSNIHNMRDLLNHIRSKPEAFHATTTANAGSRFLALVFQKRFDLPNIKQLSYRLNSELIRGVLNGESDFAVYNIVDAHGALRFITVSTPERLPTHPDVETGIEAGFPEFNTTTLSTLSTTKENTIIIQELSHLIMAACKSDNINAMFEKLNINKYCFDTDAVNRIIDSEISVLEEYKEFIK